MTSTESRISNNEFWNFTMDTDYYYTCLLPSKRNDVPDMSQSVPIAIERFFTIKENRQSLMESVITGITQQERCKLLAEVTAKDSKPDIYDCPEYEETDIEIQNILRPLYPSETSSSYSSSPESHFTMSSNDYNCYMNTYHTYDDDIFNSDEELYDYNEEICERNDFYVLSHIGLDVDDDCYEGDDESQENMLYDYTDSCHHNNTLSSRSSSRLFTKVSNLDNHQSVSPSDMSVGTNTILNFITPGSEQENLSWSYIKQSLDTDINYKIGNKRVDFNYQEIANSEILQTLFRFKDYIEVVSMKNMTMLQTLVDNITPENNNLSYGLALILVQTRNSIINLMACHGDSIDNRCHPLLSELGK